MPWPSSLAQQPPGTSEDNGCNNTSTSPTKPLSESEEKSTGHEPPPAPILDPDRRFSFVSPPSPTSTSTKPLSSPKSLNEEALLALTSEPLGHGGAWSSPPATQKSEKETKEEVYSGVGEHHQKTQSELAREKQGMGKRKTVFEDKRRAGEGEEVDKAWSKERWGQQTGECKGDNARGGEGVSIEKAEEV
ncbi:hypothetical protein NHQ30_001865 [Ciborinia camelliae]|nr:hypothetical protein NHQ30_001865 [Ciborinia camelliae]